MRIVFFPDFDGRAWPGPLGNATATFGELWTGPAGFTGVLETALGLGGPPTVEALRVVSLAATLRRTEGWWSQSVAVDPFGSARTVLYWRDTLRLSGWGGDPLVGRFADLARIESEVPTGLPDRVLLILEALESRAVDVDRVLLVEPVSAYFPLWRRVFAALKTRGVVVQPSEPSGASSAGDLAGAQAGQLRPVGDGSLQLVRSPGPVAAADDLAAWLAAQDDLENTVIISADAVLDAALARHGLPVTGAPETDDSQWMQLLPLVIDLIWDPPDPARAVELLTLASSPIPRRVARALLVALRETPAVGSDRWRQAFDESLEAIEDAARRERVRSRLTSLLEPCGRGSSVARDVVLGRVAVLREWLGVRAALGEADSQDVRRALGQCDLFGELVESYGVDELDQRQLRRLLEEATESVDRRSFRSAEAGLAVVDRPDAILGAAQRIVWWSFTRDATPVVGDVPLSREEKDAFSSAGGELPEPAVGAVRNAERWRRPLLCATESLVLVCPQRTSLEDAIAPHPLWDEITAGVDRGDVSRLIVDRPFGGGPVPTEPRERLVFPAPRRSWDLRGGLSSLREKESPTSLSSLVGCSFRWALEYAAGLRGGVTTALPEGNRLIGDVVHEAVANVLRDGEELDPDTAARTALTWFQDNGPQLTGALFQRGRESERSRVERAIVESVRELYRQMRSAGLRPAETETPRRIALSDPSTELEGRPDVVLGPRAAVIDLKWGASGPRYHHDSLENGAATQLASYSHLVKSPGDTGYPPVAYFNLAHQRLLTTEVEAFPRGEPVSGPGPEETWRAFERAVRETWSRVLAGVLESPGAPDEYGEFDDVSSRLDGDRLTLEPNCRFCDFGALCGRDGRGGAE